jgi:uncharacterized protein
MWDKIQRALAGHPERSKVVRVLLENGLAVRGSRIFVNEIEVPTLKVARVVGVDRRTVGETIRAIEGNSELKSLFSRFQSAGLSLKGVAASLGLGVVEIIADDPRKPGIIAGASQLMKEAGISIRQALVDDPELVPEPKLVLIVERAIPGALIDKLLKISGVAKVSLY